MDKQDLMRRIIELLETCLEGLEYAKTKMNEGDFENGIIMLHNMVDGYYQAELFLQPLMKDFPANQIERLDKALRNSFELVASAYEHGDSARAMELMQFGVVPNFKKWQAELNQCFAAHSIYNH